MKGGLSGERSKRCVATFPREQAIVIHMVEGHPEELGNRASGVWFSTKPLSKHAELTGLLYAWCL